MQVLIHDFEAMGTVFRFTFQREDRERVLELLPLATQLLVEADETFSTYKPSSEVTRFNNHTLSLELASGDFKHVFEQCEKWRVETKGAFNAFDPNGFYDPSGYVKAWAAQAAARFLESNGITNFTLNAGGDVYLGSEAEGLLQQVGLSHPESIAKSGLVAHRVLNLTGTDFSAVATSGSAERGDHIWGHNLHVRQVSVVASDLITADVWATALFANGPELFEVLDSYDIQAIMRLEDGQELQTKTFANLELKNQHLMEG